MKPLALLLFLAAAARAAVLPPGTYPFRTYGAEAGLGNLSAMKLAQDRDGFLWVATQDGVFRFDGTRFTRFGLESGLPSTLVPHLASRGGVLWVATAAGIAKFDGNRFVAERNLRGGANALALDANNRLWVASAQGLFVESGPHRFTPAAGWRGGEATAVWSAANGDIWVAVNGVVGCWSRNAWTWWGAPGDRFDAIVVDREKRVWVRSANRLWSKDDNAVEFVDQSSNLPSTSTNGYLCLDNSGNVWVPTDAGIAIHEPGGWRRITRDDGLPTDWSRDVIEDREGSIWVASLGVHRMLGRGELVSYKRANGLPNEVTWCFLWDRDDRLLVGTDAGLARSTADGWTVVGGTERMQIRSVIADGDAIWAAGTPAEILRIDAGGVRRYGAADGVSGRAVFSLTRDRDGAIWAGMRGGGLLCKPAGADRFTRVDLPGGKPNEDFRTVSEDSTGRLWATGENGPVCRANGRWHRFGARDGFARDFVAFMRETSKGDFWASYFEPIGMVHFHVAEENGELAIRIIDRVDTSNRIFLIGLDKRERLWIGSGAGVDVISAAGVDHIGAADGLAGDDTDAMAFYCDSTGAVFIGTSSGFSRYAARPNPPHFDPPPVRLTSTNLGRRRDFSASFSALSFYKPDIVEYEARLVGLDDSWQRLNEPRVRWSALPPGEYRFEARARLRPGPWSVPVAYAFVIVPAWWQTWWARALAVILFVGLVGLAFRGRVALLRRRNRELEALVEQRTRELAELSVTDALTGMKNRRYLQHCMPAYTGDTLRKYEVLSRSGLDPARGNADLIFFLLDLDWFKEVNDRFGHLAGDEVLVGLCELLKTIMRESDTIVRWGGEEFLFIARNASRVEAGAIAERMRIAVEQHVFSAGETSVRLTASIGFAAFPFLPEDRTRFSWEDVVDVADVCMYAAKRAGRDCWVGVTARDCRSPETLVTRVRHDIGAVIAAGELDVLSSRGAEAIRWPERPQLAI